MGHFDRLLCVGRFVVVIEHRLVGNVVLVVRLTAAERRVIEQHAVKLTKERLESPAMGYDARDVGLGRRL